MTESSPKRIKDRACERAAFGPVRLPADNREALME